MVGAEDNWPLSVRMLWMVGGLLLAGSLLGACIMDIKEQMVYRFLWLIGGVGALVLVTCRMQEAGVECSELIDLGIFIAIQQVWFARFYGRADCHAFSVCATAMVALEMDMLDYMMHMILAFVGLAVVQIIRCNVARNGRLKKPVPLIPYITVAFWLWVDFA